MKRLIITSIVLFISSFAFAGNGSGNMGSMRISPIAEIQGGSGGGGVLQREIVFHLESNRDLVRLAHGTLVDNKWHIERIEMVPQDLTSAELNALKASKALKDWVDLP